MFKKIDFTLLRKNFKDIIVLIILMFLPIILSFIYFKIIDKTDLFVTNKELLAYCMSLLAPSILFIFNTHGITYKLPWKDLIIPTIFCTYIILFVFNFLITNNINNDFNVKVEENLTYSVFIVLILIILIRVYVGYHSSKSVSFIEKKKEDQMSFNDSFKQKLNE